MRIKPILVGGLVVITIAVIWLAFQQSRDKPVPDNSTWLDQIDIKTDNPQPAGKNLTP